MTELEEKEFEFNAKQLLSNPVFLILLDEVNKGINRDMDIVKPDDLKGMQALVLLRQASTKIISYIALAAETSKVTEFNKKRNMAEKLFNRG